MVTLSSVDLETRLVHFIGNSKSDLGTKHHVRAFHVVIHGVFQSGLKRFLVNEVEIDQLICHDLNPNISSYEVDITSHVRQLFVLGPEPGFFVNLEEKNGAGRLGYESLLEKKVHVS